MYEEDVVEKLLDRIEALSMDKGRLRSELNLAEEALEVKVNVAKTVALPEIKALMVVCLSDPQNKISQIKALRELTGLNLKDAKDAVMTVWAQAGKSWEGEVRHSYDSDDYSKRDIDGLR